MAYLSKIVLGNCTQEVFYVFIILFNVLKYFTILW